MTGARRLLLPGAWLAFVAMGIFFTVRPQLKGIGRLEAQEASFSASTRQAANVPDEITSLVAQLDDIRSAAEHDIKLLPKRGDVAGFIRDLTAQLDQQGIIDHEIATGAADEIGEVFSIPVSISLVGPFLGIYASIDWLESMPRLVRILRIKIEKPTLSARAPLTASDNAVQAELLVNVYYDPAGRDSVLSLTDAEEETR